MKRLLIILVGLSSLVLACGLSDENVNLNLDGTGNDLTENLSKDSSKQQGEGEKEGEATMKVNDFLFEMEVDVLEEIVTMNMHLTNDSTEMHEITFSSGQKYNLYIKDSSGNMLYDYAEGKMFTQALVTERLGPDESLSLKEIWESEKLRGLDEIIVEAELLIYSIDEETLQSKPFSQNVTITLNE